MIKKIKTKRKNKRRNKAYLKSLPMQFLIRDSKIQDNILKKKN